MHVYGKGFVVYSSGGVYGKGLWCMYMVKGLWCIAVVVYMVKGCGACIW